MSWLTTFLDTPSRRSLPRGAPLWALRCSGREYADGVEHGLRGLRSGRSDPDAERSFTLLASEAIRRGYDGGPWSWDVVLRELRLRLPEKELRELTRCGLDGWGRPLRKGTDTRYLQSLLAEGGLPLRLLRQEGGRIRTLGAAILRDFHALSVTPDEPEDRLTAIVAQCASPYASVTYLREPTIHALLGRLLHRVRIAVEPVPAEHGSDPAGWLDARRPDWLAELPLDLSVEEARGLIQALLTEAAQVKSTDTAARIQAFVDPRDPATVVRSLTLPRSWRVEHLLTFFGLDEGVVLPRRLAIHLVTERGSVEAAHLLLQGDGGQVETRTVQPDVITQASVRVELTGLPEGARVAPAVFGDRLPGELPWVFAPATDGRWRMVGAGSLSHPAERLLVAVPADPDDESPNVGPARTLVEISEPRDFAIDGEVYTVRPRGPLDVTGELRFDGRRHPYSPPDKDVWLGLPHPSLILASGARRPVAESDLEVRLPGEAWQPWGARAIGRMEVRCRRGSCRETLYIAPPELSVEVATQGDKGVVQALGPGVFGLAIGTSRLGFVAERVGLPNGAAQLLTVTSDPPLELDVEVHLHGGARLPFRVPFPRRFAGLVDTRRPAPAWPMGLEDLTWLHGVRVGDRGAKVSLTGSLAQGGTAATPREFTVPLVATDQGERVHRLPLRALRSTIEELLAQDEASDAQVLLGVWERGQIGKARSYAMRRYRFEVFVGDADAAILGLRPTDDAVDDIVLQALRLDAPGEPWAVQRLRPGVRWIAADLPPGDWLLCARRNGVLVAQPLHASRRDTGRPTFHDRAPQEPGRTSTDPALGAQIGWLAEGIRAIHLPALGAVATDGSVARRAVMLALSSPDPVRHLAALTDGLESLPFLWEGIPLSEWELVAENAWAGLAPVRAIAEDWAQRLFVEQMDRLVDALPHTSHALAAWARKKGLPDAWFSRQDRAWVYSPKDLRVAWKGDGERPGPVEETRRRHLGKQWPTLEGGRADIGAEARKYLGLVPHPQLHHQVSVANAHERPLLLGPLLAAQAAWEGRTLPPGWVAELRRLRQFDPYWFTLAYRLSLAFLMGNPR